MCLLVVLLCFVRNLREVLAALRGGAAHGRDPRASLAKTRPPSPPPIRKRKEGGAGFCRTRDVKRWRCSGAPTKTSDARAGLALVLRARGHSGVLEGEVLLHGHDLQALPVDLAAADLCSRKRPLPKTSRGCLSGGGLLILNSNAP